MSVYACVLNIGLAMAFQYTEAPQEGGDCYMYECRLIYSDMRLGAGGSWSDLIFWKLMHYTIDKA